jgi:ABC-type lipoprotein export system ATPase subunit
MYRIDHVEIKGFWGSKSIKTKVKDGVNIIIGRNGTGKTTLMNILHSVLTVDTEGLFEHEFDEVIIMLKSEDNQSQKQIKTTKTFDSSLPFPTINYKISNNNFKMRLMNQEDARRAPPRFRREMHLETKNIREELLSSIKTSSLTVYRIRNEFNDEIDSREKMRRHASSLSPVDDRLQNLMEKLTHYQLQLSNRVRKISQKLQRDVLASLLYDEESSGMGYAKKFDKEDEKNKLISAYRQLGVLDPALLKRINHHVEVVETTVKEVQEYRDQLKTSKDIPSSVPNLAPLESLKTTRSIVNLSLQAEKDVKQTFSKLDEYIDVLTDFISDKVFSLNAYEDLSVEMDDSKIELSRLSSGEKQLIILLTEAILQREEPYVFLADEPEISLHIEWQAKIIPAIRKLNPNAQIIVATHSPEIAGRYENSLIKMENIVK